MTPAQLDLLQEWHRAKQVLTIAEQGERELRQRVVQAFFGDYGDGSRNVDVGNGYTLKNINTTRYDIKDTPDMRKLVGQFEAFPETSAAGLALVKDKPRLSISAYKALPQWGKGLLVPYVTLTPQLPQLSIIDPKA